MKILILHGPNLNLLGSREPEQYGTCTLETINAQLAEVAQQKGVEVEFYQSNHEGFLIDKIHSARGAVDGIVINAGAYTHTSIGIRDAILGCGIPTVEVHLSNIYAREAFRRTSVLSDVALGVIAGFKEQSYLLALEAIIHHLKQHA